MVSGGGAVLAEFREGLASVFYRKGENFINPAQVVNRDLSVLVIRQFWQLVRSEREKHGENGTASAKLHVLEALSATGLRALRYCRETNCIERIVANDIDPQAHTIICRNLQENADLNEILVPNCADAYAYMASHSDTFDVIDLDPFGSAVSFLDPAVRAIRHGGLLCVTCTDSRVLCGTQPEVCFARYHATSLAAPYAHEEAIRLVLGAIAQQANRHGRHMEPLLSLYIDFYVRVFVRIHDDRAAVLNQVAKTGSIYHCMDCSSYWVQPLGRIKTARATSNGDANRDRLAVALGPPVHQHCTVCNARDRMVLGGPFYLGALHSLDWVRALRQALESGTDDASGELRPPLRELTPHLAAYKRVQALLTLAHEELDTPPFYLHLPTACKALHCSMPPLSAIRHILERRFGYRCSQSHHDPLALKTNAPLRLLWGILRTWAQLEPTKRTPGPEDVRERIQQATADVQFDPPLEPADFARRTTASSSSSGAKKPRFPPHPTKNWGPLKATHFRK